MDISLSTVKMVFVLDSQFAGVLRPNLDTNCTGRACFTASQSTAVDRGQAEVAASLWNSTDNDDDQAALTYYDAGRHMLNGRYGTAGDHDSAIACVSEATSLVGVVALMSLFASLLTIGTYVRCKDLQTATRQLLVMSSVADSLAALLHYAILPSTTTTIGGTGNCGAEETVAWMQVMLSVMQMCSMLMNLAFVARTYVTVVHGVHPRPLFTFLSVAWSIGLACSSAAVITTFPESGKPEDFSTLHLRLGEPIRLTSIVAVFVLCGMLNQHVNSEVESPTGQYVTQGAIKAVRAVQLKMSLYPVLFLLVNLPLSLQVWMPAMQDCLPSSLFQILPYHGQSVFNFVLFCLMTRRVRQSLPGIILGPLFAILGKETKTAPASRQRGFPGRMSVHRTTGGRASSLARNAYWNTGLPTAGCYSIQQKQTPARC